MNLVKKCPACGTPNYHTRENCGRCGAYLQNWQGDSSGLNYRSESHTTRMLFLVIVVVVIVIGAIAIWQWGPKTDNSSMTISNITIDLITSSGARISWKTSEASSSQVSYGKTTAYGLVSPYYPADDPSGGKSTGVTQHAVILSGLSQNSLYHFKVKSKTKEGKEVVSPADMTFKTGEKQSFYGIE
jgi:hypothetical protein